VETHRPGLAAIPETAHRRESTSPDSKDLRVLPADEAATEAVGERRPGGQRSSFPLRTEPTDFVRRRLAFARWFSGRPSRTFHRTNYFTLENESGLESRTIEARIA